MQADAGCSACGVQLRSGSFSLYEVLLLVVLLEQQNKTRDLRHLMNTQQKAPCALQGRAGQGKESVPGRAPLARGEAAGSHFMEAIILPADAARA